MQYFILWSVDNYFVLIVLVLSHFFPFFSIFFISTMYQDSVPLKKVSIELKLKLCPLAFYFVIPLHVDTQNFE